MDIIVLYSSDPEVVMFQPEKITNSKNNVAYNNAVTYCSSQNARLANVNEGIAGKLSGTGFGWLSGDTGDSNRAYVVTSSGSLIKYPKYSGGVDVRCIKR